MPLTTGSPSGGLVTGYRWQLEVGGLSRQMIRGHSETCAPRGRQNLGTASDFVSSRGSPVQGTHSAKRWLRIRQLSMIASCREKDRAQGKKLMQGVVDSVSTGIPTALTELKTLGRTLKCRAEDVLAYFDRPGTSNGPTEATNGRSEHLRGSALGFRNLTNYVARSVLESGGFRPKLHSGF